ncbi:MAG: DUF922 domain-containing protein [Gemmatimonadales bacterium]|nr:MAG: DUF922 domain-containing protein [Gemmatimonadales bacterium]
MRLSFLLIWLLVVSACTSSRQLTPLGEVPQRVSVDVQETNYTIVGSTDRDLLEGMRIGGPGSGWFRFQWNMRWAYDQTVLQQSSITRGRVSQNRCGINAIRITLTFRSTVPEWEPPADVDPQLVAQWQTFTDAIRLHGEGHRDVALDAVRKIHRELELLETEDTQNCTFLQREARNVVDEIWEEHRQIDRAYHDDTQGGRSQGVVWPPRSTGT